jgi:hypothetical protein
MEYIIANSLSRRSKLIYYLQYLELRMKRYQFRKLRSADFIVDVYIGHAKTAMQNRVGPGVNGFASSRG